MLGKLEFARLKIPDDITIFDVPNIKKSIRKYNKDVLILLYSSMTSAIDDDLSEKCKNLIKEEDLFNLDEDGKEDSNKACIVTQFLIDSIGEVIVPFLIGKARSRSGHTCYMEFDGVKYAISSCNGFSYRSSSNDVVRLKLLSATNILETFREMEIK